MWKDGESHQLVIFEVSDSITVNGVVAESVAAIARVVPVQWGKLVIFWKPTLVVVDTLSKNHKACKHLRFARIGTPEKLLWQTPSEKSPENYTGDRKQGYLPPVVRCHSKLINAMKDQPVINIPGGFDFRFLFDGEIAIQEGRNGWIVPANRISVK
jgi:hypothetical protein